MIPKLQEALEELRDFFPEVTPELADPDCTECGWDRENHDLFNSEIPNAHDFAPQPEFGTPFFSESYLYWLMGKEDARTILAIIRNILRASGIPETTIQEYI